MPQVWNRGRIHPAGCRCRTCLKKKKANEAEEKKIIRSTCLFYACICGMACAVA